MLTDQTVDPLRQILDAHIAVEVRILSVEIRQHIFHPQVEIVGAFKLGQTAQQAHRPGFIDTDTEQEQQIVRPGFLHHYAALVEEFGHQRGRDPLFRHIALLVHTRRENGDFDRVEEHMVVIGILESVPRFSWGNRPALRFFNLFWLPDVKEPAVGLFTQALHLLTEM